MRFIKRKISDDISILTGEGVQYQNNIDPEGYNAVLSKTNNEIINYNDTAEALEMAISSKRAEINVKRLEAMDSKVIFNTVEYDNNSSSRFAALGAIVNGQIIGDGFSIDWIAKDDSKNTLNLSELISLGQKMSARKEAAVYNANTHKVAVTQLTTVDEVSNYDFSGGW